MRWIAWREICFKAPKGVAFQWMPLVLSCVFAASSFAGDRVVFSMVGRDECHARLVTRNASSLAYDVSAWTMKRTIQYQDTELAADKIGWGPWTAALRNQVLVPLLGNRIFQPGNTDVALSNSDVSQFPFRTIEIIENPDTPQWVGIRFRAHREQPSDAPGLPPTVTQIDWVSVGHFEVGDWKTLHSHGTFRIVLGPKACESYEQTFTSPSTEVPGFGIEQVCAWIQSMPKVAAAIHTRIESTKGPSYLEGSRHSLKFVSPSITAELHLGVPDKPSAGSMAAKP
jgi:hypothetical protein